MDPQYHVYIDEAGDPGVKPKETDEPLPTDWFVMGAVVVSNEREREIVGWVQDMEEAVRSQGGHGIHYRNLSESNKARVCRMLARKPIRLFALASNKTSMRKHYNPKLGRANDRQFYNWCLRLLLERVTAWCYRRSIAERNEVAPARMMFSERGGHNYDEMRSYFRRLEAQTLTGNLTLKARTIAPGVIKDSLCEVRPHKSVAGLQLADITASAFYQAVCSVSRSHNLDPAKALKPRLAKDKNCHKAADFGLLRLPFPHQGTIPDQDRAIFEYYGYDIESG